MILYATAYSIFSLFLNVDLLHTAQSSVNILGSLHPVSQETEIIGLLLFEIFDYCVVFVDRLLLFALPLLGHTVTDLISFCSG